MEDWSPDLGEVEPGRFKWDWNVVDGEAVVWAVSGPGDGLPAHAEHLSVAWGRRPSQGEGDVLGIAFHYPAGAIDVSRPELEQVVIQAYYGRPVPASVIRWFRQAFPNALLRPPAEG